jgi:hypothetical protein
MGADADFKVKEFRFPQFNLNVITVFETQGRLRADNVWEVFAKGPTFDGKDLFRSFFDVDVAPDRGSKGRTGLDLRANIDTVLGHYDTRLHGVRITMQKRAGKMSQLDARGSLAGNKVFEASVRNDPGRPRMLRARANDAGQMFKLVGFYPHAVGGEMNLEVNLDGKGAVERTGVLTATKFYVLGDNVTLQNPQKIDAAARREIAREKFPFETLRAPFAVGNGQFVLRDAVIDGPLVSANMRGKLDFRTRKLHVGGPFTPLSRSTPSRCSRRVSRAVSWKSRLKIPTSRRRLPSLPEGGAARAGRILLSTTAGDPTRNERDAALAADDQYLIGAAL